MSDAEVIKPEEPKPAPTSGYELAKAIDANPEETVVLAIFPEVIDEITTKELPYLDTKGEHMHACLVNAGPWGQRVIDVISPNEQPVKWWRVKAMVEGEKLDFVPIRWQGPIGEIPSQYFEKDYVLAIRFYQQGPWFFPKEQPQLKTDSTLLDAAEDAGKEPDAVEQSRPGHDGPDWI